jgi:hypothetical protein
MGTAQSKVNEFIRMAARRATLPLALQWDVSMVVRISASISSKDDMT